MENNYEFEHTEEHKAKVAERKAKLKAEAEAAAIAKSKAAKRRVIDVDATLKLLRSLKKVSPTWGNDMTPDRLRYMVRTACIAHMVEAITLTGARLNCNTANRVR